jgi:hypothetical protein
MQVYARPAVYDGEPAPESIANNVAAFYLDTAGTLYAKHGETDGVWSNVLTGVSITGQKSTSWLGLVVHLDHFNQQWDIYQVTGGTPFDATLTRLNETPLDFYTNNASFTEMSVSSELETDIDAVGAAAGSSDAGAPELETVSVRMIDQQAGLRHMVNVPRSVYDAVSGDFETGDVRNHLKTGLRPTDKVIIIEDGGDYTEYTLDALMAYSPWPPAGKTDLPGEDVMLQYAASNADQLIFVPQGLEPLVSADEPTSGSGAPVLFNIVASSTGSGWTHVRFDTGTGGASRTCSSSGLLAAMTADGGDVWIAPQTSGRYVKHVMSGSNLIDMSNGQNANNKTLRNNYGLWIRNAHDLLKPWTVN